MTILEIVNVAKLTLSVVNEFFNLFSKDAGQLYNKVYGLSQMSNDIKSMVQSQQYDDEKLYEIAKNLDEMSKFLDKVYYILK